uniref:Uncharacterized protein n=1 Tax=Glossina brevipalpis TaxID=37001 RepID=A0A1A9W7Y0_9MUSC
MKTCIGFIIIVLFCPRISPAYNWNFTAYPHFTDFTDSLNLQAALDNEMQRDLLKKPPISGIDTSVPTMTRMSYRPTAEEAMSYITPFSRNQNYDNSNEFHGTIHAKCQQGKEKENVEENDKNDREYNQDCDNSKELKNSASEPYFVGTNLFGTTRKKCFSTEDVALLTARRDFENLIPKDLPECLLNDGMIAVLINYFHACYQTISRLANDASKILAERAFHDAVGGYLNYYLVPVTKFSFYAGQVSLETAENVLQMHKQCKQFLNVNGNGWKSPMKNVLKELKKVHIEPLHMGEQTESDETSFCLRLNINSEQTEFEQGKMIVPLPKLEPEDRNDFLGNIWLPFKRKRSFDLRAENSAYIVVKFYETVTKCYQCEHVNQDCFNEKFRTWILENIQVHLNDEQFYPGLGAILRISENLKDCKRDNLYGDNLAEQDFDYAEMKQKRNKQSHTLDKGTNFDDETSQFLDNLSNSKLLNEKTRRLLENSREKHTKHLNPKAGDSDHSLEDQIIAIAKDHVKTMQQQMQGAQQQHQTGNYHKPVTNNNLQKNQGNQHQFSQSVGKNAANTNIDPLLNSGKLFAPQPNFNQFNSSPNTNIMNNINDQNTMYKEIYRQNSSKTQLTANNLTSPASKGFLRIDPSELNTPQSIIILAIPVVLFLIVCIICIKKGKRKKSDKLPLDSGGVTSPVADNKIKRLRYQSHPAVPVGSSSSVMSVSSGLLFQPKPKTLTFAAKGPGGTLETTSVDYTSSESERGNKKKGKPPPPSASTGKSAKSSLK